MSEGQSAQISSLGYFWAEVPHNVLHHPHKVSHTTLNVWRSLGTVFCLASTIWAFIEGIRQNNVVTLCAYLTIWGVWMCTLYFILIHFVKHAPHHSWSWRITYVIGEMAFCMEFLIAPFFWFILYPIFAANMKFYMFVFNVFVHLICAIFIWGEVIMNHMKFPHSHRIILIIIAVVYVINNYIWSMWILDAPVYPPIDWVSAKSYGFLTLAFVIAFAGFEVGRYQAKNKQIAGHIPLVDERSSFPNNNGSQPVNNYQPVPTYENYNQQAETGKQEYQSESNYDQNNYQAQNNEAAASNDLEN